MGGEALRDRIAQILVRHDPLRAAEDPGCDLEEVYLAEADELAMLLAGSDLGAESCASVVWAVLAGNSGPDEAGPIVRYGPIGADLAAVLDGSQATADLDEDDHDDDELALDSLPTDPIALAVLAILDDRDPAGVDDAQPTADPLEDEVRYLSAAEEIADQLIGTPPDAASCTLLARGVLETRFGGLHRARLAAVGVELAELVHLQDFVRSELDDVDLEATYRGIPEPVQEPFSAGIRALLERHDPAIGGSPGAYLAEAEDLADLLRDAEPDSVHCAAIAWTVVRRWTSAADAGGIDRYGELGRDLGRLVEMYRELAGAMPGLLETPAADGATLLVGEPFAGRVYTLLCDHDPFGLGEADGVDYVPYARELAQRLQAGSPGAGFCQVLAWKVLTEPWGGLGGSLGRFRELGRELHVLTGG
jgi:hypothetical protein